MDARRREIERYFDRLKKKRERDEIIRNRSDGVPRYGGINPGEKLDLGKGVIVSLQQCFHDGERKRELVYEAPEYTATVRDLSNLLGRGDHEIWGEDVRKWIPPGSGRYWIGDGLALYRFEEAKPHGEVRKFFCRKRLHWKRRIPGYRNRVWQCPYCLKLKIKRPPAPKVVAVVVGDNVLAGEAFELRLHFSDARLPSGSGKRAWAAVSMRHLGSGHYGGSLDDAIDQLV